MTQPLIAWLNECSWHLLSPRARPWLPTWTQLTYFLSISTRSVFPLYYAVSRIIFSSSVQIAKGIVNNFRVTLVLHVSIPQFEVSCTPPPLFAHEYFSYSFSKTDGWPKQSQGVINNIRVILVYNFDQNKFPNFEIIIKITVFLYTVQINFL